LLQLKCIIISGISTRGTCMQKLSVNDDLKQGKFIFV
jgi:hypothetical protein